MFNPVNSNSTDEINGWPSNSDHFESLNLKFFKRIELLPCEKSSQFHSEIFSSRIELTRKIDHASSSSPEDLNLENFKETFEKKTFSNFKTCEKKKERLFCDLFEHPYATPTLRKSSIPSVFYSPQNPKDADRQALLPTLRFRCRKQQLGAQSRCLFTIPFFKSLLCRIFFLLLINYIIAMIGTWLVCTFMMREQKLSLVSSKHCSRD